MRISDWSSDVCSSDLLAQRADAAAKYAHQLAHAFADDQIADTRLTELPVHVVDEKLGQAHGRFDQRLVALHAQNDECHHASNGVAAPGNRVGYAAISIPRLLERDQIGRASCRVRGWKSV